MSELILTATANGIFKSADKTIVADIKFYDNALVLTTKRGKYILKQDGEPTYPSYSTFYSGGIDFGGKTFEVQIEIMKRTAVMTW